jgi:general secretion pathway protein D
MRHLFISSRTKSLASVAFLTFCTLVQLQAQFGPGGFGGGGFGGGGNASRSRSTRTYPSNGTVGNATISIEPETRSLVVIADDETSQYISNVVYNLDRPKPQVLIKVVFMEVTHNNSSDIGVEGSWARNIGNGWDTGGITTNYSIGSSNNLITTLTPSRANTLFNGTNTFGQPITGVNGIYSILGKDYEVTLHAIAAAGNAKILSRPSVVARNNQPATILVGQTVPLINSVRYDSLGNAIYGIQYTDVGIILRVTPFITPDGMVEMILSPETSSVDQNDKVPLSANPNGPSAQVIDKRSADTVVVTPNGQTVIIGGMMQNSKTDAETKIPLLGDIPIIGNFFKRTIKSTVKTELLIFLTPHVLQAPGEMATISASERERSDGVKDFSEKELDKFLDALPTKDPATGKVTKPNKKKKSSSSDSE